MARCLRPPNQSSRACDPYSPASAIDPADSEGRSGTQRRSSGWGPWLMGYDAVDGRNRSHHDSGVVPLLIITIRLGVWIMLVRPVGVSRHVAKRQRTNGLGARRSWVHLFAVAVGVEKK